MQGEQRSSKKVEKKRRNIVLIMKRLGFLLLVQNELNLICSYGMTSGGTFIIFYVSLVLILETMVTRLELET
jgi:hypothetical protein